MAGEVIVDALPYIDQVYEEPGVREAAISMIEDEMRRYRPAKNYLDHLPPLDEKFETEIMRSEFDRLQKRFPKETMSMKRYELPLPPAGKLTDISAWNQSLENSMAQLELQATRISNLDLVMDYCPESRKSDLEVLEKCVADAHNQLTKLKKQIQEVNFQRKSVQVQVGEKLRDLESSKDDGIELACARLEKQIRAIELANQERMDTQ